MADILLINSTIKLGHVARGIQHYPPVGLAYLAAALELRGMSVAICDLSTEPLGVDDVCDLAAKLGVKLVGLASVSPQIHNTMRVVRGLRARFGDSISIALGGYHISNDPTFLERYPEVDFGVTGDGDITFPDLAEKVLGGLQVKGLYEGVQIKSFDDVPYPAYHLVDMNRYKAMGLTRYPTLATRGCPFSCIFCSRSPASRRVRVRSPENLIGEMDRYYDEFDGNFEFMDESFTLRRSNVVAMCQALIEWGKPILWSAGSLRLDQVDNETAELMWQAGCRSFFVGVESGNERVRNKIIGKKIKDADMFRAFKILDQFGFDVEASLVIGHPTETEEEMRQTCYFPLKLKKSGIKCLGQIGIKPAVPMPGSRLWKVALEEGKMPTDFIDRYINFEYGEDFWQVWPTYVPDGLTQERMNALRKEGYMAYYLRPGYIWWRLKRNIANPHMLVDDLKNAWTMLTKGHSTVSLSD